MTAHDPALREKRDSMTERTKTSSAQKYVDDLINRQRFVAYRIPFNQAKTEERRTAKSKHNINTPARQRTGLQADKQASTLQEQSDEDMTGGRCTLVRNMDAPSAASPLQKRGIHDKFQNTKIQNTGGDAVIYMVVGANQAC